jgi:hypothetical protein
LQPRLVNYLNYPNLGEPEKEIEYNLGSGNRSESTGIKFFPRIKSGITSRKKGNPLIPLIW